MDQHMVTEPKNFEEALARLEEISVTLDRNEIPLAEALDLCSEAAKLTRYCRTQLTQAEGKLEQLIESANGELQTIPISNE